MKFFSLKSHLLQSADKELVRKVRSNQNAWDYSEEKKGDFSRVNSIETDSLTHKAVLCLISFFLLLWLLLLLFVVTRVSVHQHIVKFCVCDSCEREREGERRIPKNSREQ